MHLRELFEFLEFGSLHMEFSYLSDITGNPVYKEKVDKVREVITRASRYMVREVISLGIRNRTMEVISLLIR
jgi:hypothetical protein